VTIVKAEFLRGRNIVVASPLGNAMCLNAILGQLLSVNHTLYITYGKFQYIILCNLTRESMHE